MTTPDQALIHDSIKVLAGWTPNDNDLTDLGALTERSLKEVKALTEYEDTKAQRILAAVAFLAALAGGLFAASNQIVRTTRVDWIVAGGFYVGFALYVGLLVIGSALVLYAVLPRFTIPPTWDAKVQHSKPKSFLFFEKIISVSPIDWAKAYTESTVSNLKREYIRNSIFETYLVAQKIREKLIPLKCGVRIILVSTTILFPWAVLAILISGQS